MDCLVNGEPEKSHENLVELDTRAHAFAVMELLLEGDWEYLEDFEDE